MKRWIPKDWRLGFQSWETEYLDSVGGSRIISYTKSVKVLHFPHIDTLQWFGRIGSVSLRCLVGQAYVSICPGIIYFQWLNIQKPSQVWADVTSRKRIPQMVRDRSAKTHGKARWQTREQQSEQLLFPIFVYSWTSALFISFDWIGHERKARQMGLIFYPGLSPRE